MKSSSGDRSDTHPYIRQALKEGASPHGWTTSKIKRTLVKGEVLKVRVTIIERSI
jgi:hypothetical protein